MHRGEPSAAASVAPDGIQTRADLAAALTALRARSGMTVRELARRLDMPSATIGGYVSGRHLPGPGQLRLFCALLRECGVAEGELDGWTEAVARIRITFDRRVSRATTPYRGLEPFRSEDSELFFGREEATAEILGRLRDLRAAAGAEAEPIAMLLVVGASGSGKSSLLRAGVQARVQAGALDGDGVSWSTAVIRPGSAGLDALHRGVAELDGGARLLIIDQFEEVFSLPPEERRAFFEGIRHLCALGTLIVAGLRADFYEAALREALLLPLLRTRQILLGPMTASEIRRAISQPAAAVGVHVEDGLVDLLMADLAPGSPTGFAHDVGALPLLSHALLATWERASRNDLTIADYREAGGLRGAVRQSAEELYISLDPRQRDVAGRMFCRLVRVQDGVPLTRRRVARHELEELDGAEVSQDGLSSGLEPDTVLGRFVAARLITIDAETAQLSHEALLTAWPRLATWIEHDRSDLRLHGQLTEATDQWIESSRDPALLLRGARLQVLAEWADEPSHRAGLNRAEREYLEGSIALAESERRAAHRRTRRMQQLVAAAVTLAAIAVVLAIVAFHAGHRADVARDQALSRQVAIEAGDLQPTDPSLAMQLSLAAYRISPTVQATSQLLQTSGTEMPTRLLGPTGPTTLALSANGRELAVAYSNADLVKLFTLSDGYPKLMATISGGQPASLLYAIALSPDGHLLAAAGTGPRVLLWSLTRGRRPVKLDAFGGFSGTVYGLSFARGGDALAAAVSDGTVHRWSLERLAHPLVLPTLIAPGRSALQAVSYSPSASRLAAVGANGTLVVWPAAGSHTRPLSSTSVAPTILTSVVYSPNGRTLVAGGQNALVYVWRIARGGRPQGQRSVRGFSSWVDSLAFSRDGRYLAAGGSDNSIRVWSTSTWSELAELRQPAPVTGIGFGPADQSLVSADEDGTASFWQFPPPATYRAPGPLYTIDYTAGGGEMAAVSGGPGGDVSLWNVSDPWRPVRLSSVTPPASFGPVAGVGVLSPNGKLLAIGNAAAKVQLVDLSQQAHPRLVGGILGGAVPNIEQLTFSPDMKLLSVADDAGRIHLWNISDPMHPRALPTLDRSGASSNVFGVAYSPNGQLLAAACADHEVWLWDVANPLRPRRLAVLSGFASYVYTVAFTPNGKTLIAGSADDTVRLWDVSDPAHPRLLGRPLTGPTSTVYQVNVSPDGDTLAASTTGQQVWLWNIADPARPRVSAELSAASGEVFDVNFSPDGQTLVAGGTDRLLQFWDYRPSRVAARICALAGTPITRAEWAEYVQGARYDPPCR